MEVELNTTATACYGDNDYCLSDEDYVDMIENWIFPLKPYDWLFIVLYMLVFVVGLTGNLLVCFAIWRNHYMRTVTNGFIMNLAIADLLVIIFCLPATLVEDVVKTWFLGDTLCKVIKYLQAISVEVSVLTLSFISLDRFKAICHPLKFKSAASKVRNIVVGFVIWIIPLTIHVPELVFLGITPPKTNRTALATKCSPLFSSVWTMTDQNAYQLVLLVLLYIIPLALMGFCYTRIARSLWGNNIPGLAATSQQPCDRGQKNRRRHAKVGNKSSGGSAVGNPESQLRARRNVAKMLIAIVVMFAVCYMPVHLLNIFRYAQVMEDVDEEHQRSFAAIAHWLCYFNSAVNPIIYNFMSATFKKEFKHACSCFVPKDGRKLRTGRFKESSYKYTQSSFMSRDRAESMTMSSLKTTKLSS